MALLSEDDLACIVERAGFRLIATAIDPWTIKIVVSSGGPTDHPLEFTRQARGLEVQASLRVISTRENFLSSLTAALERELNDPRLILTKVYDSPEEAAMLHAVTLDPPEVDFINRAIGD